MLDPRGGAGKPPLPRAVRSALSPTVAFPKGPNESASGGDDDERSDDSVNERKKKKSQEKPSPLAHVNGAPSHPIHKAAAPFHVTLVASNEVSKALSKKDTEGNGMGASARSDEKGLDGWKKRTDQLAAAVLASARLSRGPSSPPSPPVVADPPPPYPPETSPAPFSRPPSLPDSPVGQQFDLTSEWTLSQTEWTGLGLGNGLPTNPNSPNPMSPTDSNYHLLDPNSIPPMPPPLHHLPPDQSSVPPFQPIALKPSSVPPIAQPQPPTLTMRPAHRPKSSLPSPVPPPHWVSPGSYRPDENGSSIPPQTPPPLPYPLANMAPVFVPDPDALHRPALHYGSAAPIMQQGSVPPLMNRGSAPPTPQAVVAIPAPRMHHSQRSPPTSLYASSPGVHSHGSVDPKLYYSYDAKPPHPKDPKSPRQRSGDPKSHLRNSAGEAIPPSALWPTADPGAKSPRASLTMVQLDRRASDPRNFSATHRPDLWSSAPGPGQLLAPKSPRQRDPKSPRQLGMQGIMALGDGAAGRSQEPDLISMTSTKSESQAGKAAVAGVGIVFKESKREGIRVVSVVKGGGASKSTRPPFPGDVLIGVDGSDVRGHSLAALRERLCGREGDMVVLLFQDSEGKKYETHLRRSTPNLRPLGDDGTSCSSTPRNEKSEKTDKSRTRQTELDSGADAGPEEGDSPLGVTASFININEELERVRGEAQERINSALRRERMLQEELRAVRETSKARSRMEQEHRSQLEAENEKLREDLKEESKRFRAERARREALEEMVKELQRRGSAAGAAGAPRKMEMPSAPRTDDHLQSDEEDDTHDVTGAYSQAAGGTGAELVASTVVQGPGTDDDKSGDSSGGGEGFAHNKLSLQTGTGLAGAYF